MKLTSQHIPFAKLTDLAEGRLASDERASSLAHVKDCSHCSAQLAQLDQIINLMRTDTMADAPRDVMADALGLFRQRKAAAPSLVRRVLAALNFDSLQLTPAFGVRSGQMTSRQLLYTTGENDLDVRVTQSKEAWIVSGQVLGNCAGGRVHLEGTSGAADAELNELCEFAFPPVPAGSYTLRLRLAETEIEVPEIELN